jgi:serine protease Do
MNIRCSPGKICALIVAAAIGLYFVSTIRAADDELTPVELAAIRAAEEARISAIDSVYGAVVAIYGNDRKGGGSGVLYDPAGYALTNHHVVAAAGVDGWAGLADGKLYRWKIIGTDPGGDVAIIQLEAKEKGKRFPTAPLADSDKVRVGDWAMAMGNPFVLAEDQRPTVTLGIVSGVHRYQAGSGMNQLVYGNCIQVDSSINPGNSGGPLFSLRGEVIGINGRGSFEERGRVNVGLGYAISANQVRNFIPELLSTKMAQHGTLDAQFGNRLGGVICQSVNLDSAVAKAGLELSDRLISFEGVKINDANQFTNLISIYPAGWPVTLTFEREGKQHTVTVRLTSLPYEPIVKEQPKIEPVPEKKPEEKKPDEEKKPAGDKPAEEKKPEAKPAEKSAEPTVQETQSEEKKDEPKEEKKDEPKPEKPEGKEPPKNPMPQIKMPAQKPNFGKAGEVRDAKLNATIARELAGRWQFAAREFTIEGQNPGGLSLASDIFRQEVKIGSQLLTFNAQGQVHVQYEIDGKTTSLGFDGKTYWLKSADKAAQEITAAKAHRDPHFAQGAVLAGLLQQETWKSLGKIALNGSDKAAGRLCYRLELTDSSSEQVFVWLSVVNDQLQPAIQLVKSGVGIDDDEPIASTVYRQWKRVANVDLPHERTLVRKLVEEEMLRIVTTSVMTSQSSAEAYQLPKEAK